MSVPDWVTFGLSINVGQMRALSMEDRIPHLKKRVEFFLIDQVDAPEIRLLVEEAIASGRLDKDHTVYPKPFQLPVMSCIAFETLAQMAFSFSYRGDGFKQAIAEVDPLFSTVISTDFKQKMANFILQDEPEKELAKINTYGDLLYSHFRNTMIHGYRATGVFLDHLQKELVVEGDGFLVLNPMLFWASFKTLFDKVFDDIINKPDCAYRIQCEKYLEKMLK